MRNSLALVATITSVVCRTLWGATEIVDGIEWRYSVVDGVAVLGGDYQPVIPIGTKGDVIVPDTLGGAPVKVVCESAFRQCDEITSLAFPEGITNFDLQAVAGAEALVSVSLPVCIDDDWRWSINWSWSLDDCPKLRDVQISPKSTCYCSIGGCVYNKAKTELMYCPMAVTQVVITAECQYFSPAVLAERGELQTYHVEEGNECFEVVDDMLFVKNRQGWICGEPILELFSCPSLKSHVVLPQRCSDLGSSPTFQEIRVLRKFSRQMCA